MLRPSERWMATRVSAFLFASLVAMTPLQAETADRTVVRFTAPETGGTAKPRFLMEREVSTLTRLEALLEEGVIEGEFQDRYQKVVVSRMVAEQMLAQLQIESGAEPPKLLEYVARIRETLETRVGGAEKVREALVSEGLSEAEFMRILLTRARAMAYIDRGTRGLFAPSEEELYAGWRTMPHPYRSARFEDMRTRFAAYYAYERFRTLEIDFVQSARGRLMVHYL